MGPTPTPHVRLFIAVTIPEAWHARLVDVSRDLETAAPGVCRWVRPEGFHITLAFLGNQSPSVVPLIQKAMALAVVDQTDFDLRPARLGTFGSRGNVQVVWAAIADEPAGMLAGLQSRVATELRSAGVGFESGPFRPHITLGRGRRGAESNRMQAMYDAVAAHSRWDEGTSICDRIVLFQSDLRPTGSVYTVIHEAAFDTQANPTR